MSCKKCFTNSLNDVHRDVGKRKCSRDPVKWNLKARYAIPNN